MWERVDYLTRVGQAAQAVPFLKQFQAANPDDTTYVALRDEYGQRSFFRLLDAPETRPFAQPILDRLAEAGRKFATRPDRLAAAIAALPRSRDEHRYAVERLREAGPYAVPALIQALQKPGLPPEERSAVVEGLGALDPSAVPPLIATLDAPDPAVASAAAEALAAVGDPRAVPPLTALAAKPGAPASEAARGAIARLTGRPFEAQPAPPARVLADSARAAFLAAPKEPDAKVIAWDWDDSAKAPAPRETTRADAMSAIALKLARHAAELAPGDREIRQSLLEIALDRDPAAAEPEAVKAGPTALAGVVRQAIADHRGAAAAAAIGALAKVTDPNILAGGARPGALADALDAPDRRVQFAAAKALVGLDPRRGFPGSSRVVPTLTRFVAAGQAPRAVVVDGNADRASLVVGFLKGLGYDAQAALTGEDGFRMAAGAADVELIAIDPDLVQGHWRLVDLLANLAADPQTAGIPTFLYGPLALHDRLEPLLGSFPRVKLLVTPTQADLFRNELARGLIRLGARPLSAEERAAYAKEATALLAGIATRPGGPFEPELVAAEPALFSALNHDATAFDAARALGEIPRRDAQRALCDVLLDPANSPGLRVAASEALVRSLRRSGSLLAREQEAQLATERARADEPTLRAALSAALDALKPRPASSGRRPAPGASPAPASAPPATTPAPAAAPAAAPGG